MVAGRVFYLKALCELERMQGKMDIINNLIDKKFVLSKPKPILIDSWFEA